MKKLLLILFLLPVFCFSQTYLATQIGEDIDGESAGDFSGGSVSLSADGTIVVIGANFNRMERGHVRVYENIGDTWTKIGQDIDGDMIDDHFGSEVVISLDGSTIGILANPATSGTASPGYARIYENISGNWVRIGVDFYDPDSISLSSDGSIVAIGKIFNNGLDSPGHVQVFENISGTWTQIGDDIIGESNGDWFGNNVSISTDGSIVAINGLLNDDGGNRSGHVRIYENILGTWTQIGQDIYGEAEQDLSGFSLSLSSDGSIVAIGTPYNYDSGHVRVYENILGTWTQIGEDLDGESAGDRSGSSISLSSDGSVVAIGATHNPANGARSGHTRIYHNIAGTWTQQVLDINGEAFADWSGASVSISSDGSIVAIGAFLNDGNGDRSGHVRVFDLTTPLSTEEFNLFEFSIHPNPAKESIEITLNQGQDLQKVNIYNNLGQFIQTSNTHLIKTSHLGSGLYYVEVITNTGKATKKLIIE